MDSLLTSNGGHIMHTGSRSNSTGGIIGMSSSISNDGVGTINGPARSSSCHGAIGDLTASNLAPLSIPSSTPGVFQHCSLSLFHGTQLPSSTASPASPSILSPHIGLGDTSNISLLSRRRSNRPDEGFVAPDLSLAMNTLPPLPPLPSLPTMPLGQQYQQPSGVAPTSATLDLLGGAGKILQLPSPSLHQYQQPTPTSGTLPPPLAKFSYPSPAGMTYQHRHRLGSRASADSLSQLSRELDISRVQNGTINNYHINNTTNQLAELVQKQPVASTMASGLSTPVLSNRSSVHSVRDTEADSLSTNNNNKVDLQADRTSSNTSDNSSASTSNTPPSLVSDSDIAGNASDHQQQQPAVEDSAIAKLHSMIATLKSMKKVPLSATNGTFSPSTAATDEIAATYTSNANMDNSNNNNSSTNSNGPIISTSVSSSSNTGSNQQRKRPTHARSRSVALSPTTFASLVPASSIPNTPKATPTHFPPHHHYGQGPHQRPPIHPLGNHHSRPANNGSHTPGLSSYGSRSHLRQSSHAPSLMSTTQHHQQLAQVLDSNKSRNRSSTTSLRAQLDMPWRDGATTATSAVAAS
ncbi:hypothetical protein GQ42DRAFT_25770 [Ramicandelaber brevisporus]|nr:hypothetical protein GQ42DRAFT_25770 [Ramicandelaber brevisporus]